MPPLTRPLAATSPSVLKHPARIRNISFSVTRTSHRRTEDFSSGFTSSYDPNQDSGRGPMFTNKVNYGVPQFYPRDLKKRVDDYVVGQDRAKKSICATMFNHYQAVRRRQYEELADRKARAKIQRQRAARDGHPVDDEQSDSVFQRYYVDDYNNSGAMASGTTTSTDHPAVDSNIFESLGGIAAEDKGIPEHVKIDKSNILLIGPTGVGKTYILEQVPSLLLTRQLSSVERSAC